MPNIHPDRFMIERFLRVLYLGARLGYLTIMRKLRMSPEFFDVALIGMDQVAARTCAMADSDDVFFGVGLRAEKLDGGRRGDADSVIALPSFWLDCDIKGPAHKEPGLPPDEDAAMQIVLAAGIKPTLVVKTGYGLHAHYQYNQPLVIDAGNRERVKALMARFHSLTAAAALLHGWKLDNTSDLPRILRPAGTVNRKLPLEPKLVTFEVTGPRYEIEDIERRISNGPSVSVTPGFDGFAAQRELPEATGKAEAADPAPELEPECTATGTEPVDQQAEFPSARIEPIVTGCSWMRHCRDDAEMLPEPQWYAMLSVLVRCEDGERLAHEWSRPYPRYTFIETQKKLRHALEDGGPVTCGRIMDSLGQQEFCGTCLCREYLNSPISLGTVEPVLLDLLPVESAPVESLEPTPEAAAPFTPVSPLPTPVAVQTASVEPSPPAAATAGSKPWPELKALKTALPPVPAFDPALLPGAFRDYGVDVAERMQVPLDFAAAALLVGLAAVVGRRAMITPKERDTRWVVVPNLWGGIVSRPGNLKSPLIGEIFRPLRALEKAAIEAHKLEMEDYEREFEEWDARKKKARKDAESFDDPKPERPPGLRYLVNDATIEKMHAISEDNPQGVLLFRDELAGWFASLDTKGHERERPFFLEGWNGDGSYTIDRIGRGTLYVEYLCISVFGGIQPAKLQNYLTDAVIGGGNDDGLVQRLQVLVWPDQDMVWRNIDRPPNTQAANGVEQVFRKIAEMPVEPPFQTRFAPDAQALFNEWREELEQQVRNGKLPRFLESHLAKYRSLMPSIALLLHIADGSREPQVPLIQAQRAAQWCVYLEAHARRVYACVTSLGDRAAAILGEKIQKGDLGVRFTARQVYLKGWANLTKLDQVQLALGVLQDAGWVRVTALLPGPQGGRPTEVYDVNPGVRHE